MIETTGTSPSFGAMIRKTRSGFGWSLRSFAEQLTISPAYLSDIENDRRIPAEDLLAEMARRLAVDRDFLMAQAGRLGEEAEAYLHAHPTAVHLVRRIAARGLNEDALKHLLRQVEETP